MRIRRIGKLPQQHQLVPRLVEVHHNRVLIVIRTGGRLGVTLGPYGHLVVGRVFDHVEDFDLEVAKGWHDARLPGFVGGVVHGWDI